jgi:hypothetical protein
MIKSSRKAALADGEKSYFTGSPCVKGHVSARRSKTGECLECRKLRLVEWRKDNPAKVAVHNQTQYEKFPEELKTRSRAYYHANVEKCRASSQRYQKENPHIYAAINAKYKASKLNQTPDWLANDDFWLIEQIYELAALRTKLTGLAWQVDHIIPLQGKLVSGLHIPSNLQVIPAKLNRAKSNKYPVK